MNQANEKYNRRVEKINSLLCVGLDPDFEKLPHLFKAKEFPQFEFCKWIIEQTVEFAAAFKPNPAFYEARGEQGMKELKMVCGYIHEKHSDVFLILDSKRGDIGNTNQGYVTEAFNWAGADAVTVSPYLGKEAVMPYLEYKDKVIIILCRTSNPGAGEFQDMLVSDNVRPGMVPLWQKVANNIITDWNFNNNCMVVCGAPYPKELALAREILGDLTILVPGIGAQGGEVEATVKAGLNSKKMGLIINSSRGIIFSENPKAEAQKMRDEINKYR